MPPHVKSVVGLLFVIAFVIAFEPPPLLAVKPEPQRHTRAEPTVWTDVTSVWAKSGHREADMEFAEHRMVHNHIPSLRPVSLKLPSVHTHKDQVDALELAFVRSIVKTLKTTQQSNVTLQMTFSPEATNLFKEAGFHTQENHSTTIKAT